MLQLADFLMGALSYNLNDSDKKVIAKRQIIDRIKHHTTQSLDATSYNNSFNMFFIELK